MKKPCDTDPELEEILAQATKRQRGEFAAVAVAVAVAVAGAFAWFGGLRMFIASPLVAACVRFAYLRLSPSEKAWSSESPESDQGIDVGRWLPLQGLRGRDRRRERRARARRSRLTPEHDEQNET